MRRAISTPITGPTLTLEKLAALCTRRRAGGRRAAAKRLRDACKALADRRWARATKGQRRPKQQEAVALATSVRNALATVQYRARKRLMTWENIVTCAQRAARDGSASLDGGWVNTKHYKYSWETTEAFARRLVDGRIEVEISRNGRRATISAPAATWQHVTMATDVLLDNGYVGVRDTAGHWRVYDSACALTHVAVPMPDDCRKYGRWEHGADVATCAAEIARKRQIIAAGQQQAARDAARAARQERRARLLARVSAAPVTAEHARAVGACKAGIEQFASRFGIPLTGSIPLRDLARFEPLWALRIAKRALESQ